MRNRRKILTKENIKTVIKSLICIINFLNNFYGVIKFLVHLFT